VKMGYAEALAESVIELTRRGIPTQLCLMHGNCHVDDGRNAMVRDFMNSNCTDLVQIDADTYWKPDALIKLLSWDEDFITGAYPKKCLPQKFPVGRILHARDDGLLEVSFAPTGFMRTRRRVFEELKGKVSSVGKNDPMHIFFERKFNGNTRDGGDVTFCRRWIAAGGKVLVDPTLKFGHIGEHVYQGQFSQYLKKEENAALHADTKIDPNFISSETPLKKAVDKLGTDLSDEEVSQLFNELADHWGNKPWAATPDFVESVFRIAGERPAGSKILECGSGLTTFVLAAAAKLYDLRVLVVEQERLWATKIDQTLREVGLDEYVELVCTPVEDEWYSKGFQNQLVGADFDMVVIDGPRRVPGETDRLWPIRNQQIADKVVSSGTVVFVDDASSVDGIGTFLQSGSDETRHWCVGVL
jgi:hypothetical protein